MRIVFLDAQTLGEDANLAPFEALGDVTVYDKTAAHETLSRIQEATVVVTNKVVITKAHMQAALELKLICVAATGMNNIDVHAAKEASIEVKNVAGYSTQSVVQHTFSMLFFLMGQSRYYDDYVKQGRWAKNELFTHIGASFHEISGLKWGIIGMGTIGQKVAQAARAFGCDVSYYSTSGANTAQPYHCVALETLLAESDIISIHAPLNNATQGLLSQPQLAWLKEEAVLLNLGRGGIIDEVALAHVQEQKKLYVGLDVLEQEPIGLDHPLLQPHNPRIYITPHIAWTSIEARKRLMDTMHAHIQVFILKQK